MLRRTQAVAFKKDEESPQNAWKEEAERAAAQRTDRRNQDALRAEFLQALIASDEAGTVNPVRMDRPRVFTPFRVTLLVVALVAGGSAAGVAVYGDRLSLGAPTGEVAAPTPTPAARAPAEAAAPPPAPQIAKTRVLVAKTAIPAGKLLTLDALEWAEWPDTSIRPEYMTITSAPNALSQLAGTAASVDLLPGEPIRTGKLQDGRSGFLAGRLPAGTRGVSIVIGAESASGGFIVPDDRVDVVLTRVVGTTQASSTILRNVRVITIGADPTNASDPQSEGADASEVGEKRPTGFANVAIATLELDPRQAEVVINATMVGKLSLVLRPAREKEPEEDARVRAANEAIRLSSPFWRN